MNLFFSKTDINALLFEAFYAWKHHAQERRIQFDLSLPAVNFTTCVDREALYKLFSELIYDAIQTAKSDVEVALLPFDNDDTIFKVEFRCDGALLNREQFKAMYSEITVPKKWVTLPVPNLAAALPKKQVHSDGVDRDRTLENEKPLILIVEDDKEILAYLNKELKSVYHILRASNATEALHILAKDSVQIVLMEAGMPLLDGIALCKYMKSNRLYNHIPVIFFTDSAVPEAKIQGLTSGADACIEKPFSIELLMLQINNILTNRKIIFDHVCNSLRSDAVAVKQPAPENFIEHLNAIIYDNISDIDLTVDELAKRVNMSRPTLYRTVKRYSELTPNEMINISKLKRAAELLVSKKYNITQIATMVGYTVQSNFSRDFHKYFGTPPSIYGIRFGKQPDVA